MVLIYVIVFGLNLFFFIAVANSMTNDEWYDTLIKDIGAPNESLYDKYFPRDIPKTEQIKQPESNNAQENVQQKEHKDKKEHKEGGGNK